MRIVFSVWQRSDRCADVRMRKSNSCESMRYIAAVILLWACCRRAVIGRLLLHRPRRTVSCSGHSELGVGIMTPIARRNTNCRLWRRRVSGYYYTCVILVPRDRRLEDTQRETHTHQSFHISVPQRYRNIIQFIPLRRRYNIMYSDITPLVSRAYYYFSFSPRWWRDDEPLEI